MSCSKIKNAYDGIAHDYTRKQGLVWEQIYLPPHAPREWQDRANLWNAVELAEKDRDSRLARELIVALPIELSPETNQWLLEDFIQHECIAKGMCADVCYHDTDGHNPHAHILLTVRPLDRNGKWQPKTQKEYLCVRNGLEKAFTSAECKATEREGWEKQYLYQVGNEKWYLPPSRAEGLVRINRYPKATKYGRQNPIYESWNSEAQLMQFRKAWASCVNEHLGIGEVDTRVDHRSYQTRGLQITPTIHAGVVRGVSERRKINQQIRKDNSVIAGFCNAIILLTKAVGLLIMRAASELEELRTDLLVLTYEKRRGNQLLNEYKYHLNDQGHDLEVYHQTSKLLAEKDAELDELRHIKHKTPKMFKGKHKELDAAIYALSEEVSEIRHTRDGYRNRIEFDFPSIEQAEKNVHYWRTQVAELQSDGERYTQDIADMLAAYRKVETESASLDQNKLTEARQSIRRDKENEAITRIDRSCLVCYDDAFYEAKREVAELLGEEAPKPAEKKPVEPIAPLMRTWTETANRRPLERRKTDWER